VEELLSSIEQDQRALIAADIDQAPDQPLGQLNGIVAKKMAEIGEAIATAYNAFNRGAAEGPLLDNIGTLTGVARAGATKSRVTVNCDLDALTPLPAGSVVNVSGQPATRFESVELVTSTSAGVYPVVFECEQTGPVAANAGTLTVIATPVAGWNSATNPLDADLGTNVEEDVDYRIRQVEELAAFGACTVDAIRADLLQISGVQQAFVFENTTLITDGAGVPGKAFEAVIWDGTAHDASNQEVADTIWKNKPSGIQDYGHISQTVLDSHGESRTVYFSRATEVDVYMSYVLTVDATKYPVDGDAQVKAAVIALGKRVLSMSDDVVFTHFVGAPFAVAGVLDVVFTLGLAPSPTGVINIPIGAREIAVLDTSRITVTS
jgi:uncharacterized phage protein gp47/JayE